MIVFYLYLVVRIVFQAHILVKKYGLKPLAVTFSHNWYTEVGVYNLHRCLECLIWIILITPARK